jgi:signal transduction histidine kinase
MKSLRRHLTRTLLGAIAALGGAGLLALLLAAREAAIEQFDEALQAKALAISTLTELGPDGVRVELDLAEVAVEADPALLRSILDNVLENAVEYASAPGLVKITVPSDREALVSVANTVADLTPADLPLLFERFWRKEAARSGGRHIGLGLPLARAFAEAMGWRLEAALRSSNVLEIALLASPKPA